MKVGIADISLRCGVSTATVSRALSGKDKVKKVTRDLIIETARELGYPLPRDIVPTSDLCAKGVAAVLPSLWGDFYGPFLRCFDEMALENNYTVSAVCYHNKSEEVVTHYNLLEDRISGAVIVVSKPTPEDILNYRKAPFPIVLINAGDCAPGIPVINIENYQGTFALTEHLIRLGYKRNAIIRGPEGNRSADQRVQAFRDALETHGLELNNELIALGDFTRSSGYYGFTRLLSLRDKPDAIFASNDAMAMGAFQAARAMRIKIPEDVAIAGFDNIPECDLLSPGLTTVHVPVEEIVSRAFMRLQSLMRGEDLGENLCEYITTGIVVRDSCGEKMLKS